MQFSFFAVWAVSEMTTEARKAWDRTLDDFARFGDRLPLYRIGTVWARLFRDLGLIRSDYHGLRFTLTEVGMQAE